MLKRYRLDHPGLNAALERGFLANRDAADVRRTHLFNGRYENIYLTPRQVPELDGLVEELTALASDILGRSELRHGLWFNDMPPGAVTTRHNHDNDDELLSCVYYVTVPDGSGDFVLHDRRPPTRITPHEGDAYFFPPHVDHEVTANHSDRHRLSIAVNFGPALDGD